MKTSSRKPASKTPIDVLRRLEEARRALNALTDALAGIDGAAFPSTTHLEAAHVAGATCQAAVLQMLFERPLTKTERAARLEATPAAEPVAPAAPEPEAAPFALLAAVEPTPAPEAVQPAPEPAPEVTPEAPVAEPVAPKAARPKALRMRSVASPSDMTT